MKFKVLGLKQKGHLKNPKAYHDKSFLPIKLTKNPKDIWAYPYFFQKK